MTTGPDLTVRDTVRAVRPVGSDPRLGEQPLRELRRLEHIWHGLGVRPRYVVAEQSGRTVGLVPVYPVLGRHYLGWTTAQVFPGVDAARAWRRGVLVGSDLTGSNVLAAPGRPDVVIPLLREAVALAAAEGADHVCLPHLYDDQYDALCGVAPDRTLFTSESGDAMLDLTFSSFEEYVRGLPSRRTAIRRERHRFLAAGRSPRAGPIHDVLEDMAGLQAQVERKYGRAAATREAEELYLVGIAMAMGDAGSVLGVREAGRLLAGSVLWDLGDEWRVRCWGCDLDHPAVRRDYLYFNLMYYEPMLRARAAGAKRLLLGTGSLDTKAIRGARIRRRRSVAWELDGHVRR